MRREGLCTAETVSDRAFLVPKAGRGTQPWAAYVFNVAGHEFRCKSDDERNPCAKTAAGGCEKHVAMLYDPSDPANCEVKGSRSWFALILGGVFKVLFGLLLSTPCILLLSASFGALVRRLRESRSQA